MSVAIVDLGYGNIGSIAVAFQRLGATVTLTADPAEIAAAERVALPGVGAAGYAMGRIDALGLRETLTGLTRPLLGICLGMQLLFEASEEEDTACLGLIAGKVRRLEPGPGLTVPHMGWSRLDVTDEELRPGERRLCLFRAQLRLRRRPRQHRHRAARPDHSRRDPQGQSARRPIPPRAQRRGRRALPQGVPRMLIYPAIDLMGGRCVRLSQGRFEDATIYPADPAEALAAFADAGAIWTHIVDLDGAREKSPRQHDLIAGLARDATQQLQVAGGFRTRDQLVRMFDAGVARVVIGSLAVQEPETVAAFIAEFGGERITLAFDMRLVGGTPEVATSGWLESSGTSLWDALALYPEARHILVTDIGRDGMMTGPNTGLIAEIVSRCPALAVQASGGVSSLADLRALQATGAAGAIVGKALWEERFGLAEALDAGR